MRYDLYVRLPEVFTFAALQNNQCSRTSFHHTHSYPSSYCNQAISINTASEGVLSIINYKKFSWTEIKWFYTISDFNSWVKNYFILLLNKFVSICCRSIKRFIQGLWKFIHLDEDSKLRHISRQNWHFNILRIRNRSEIINS